MSGMTLWRARVNKVLGSEEWSNTYVLNAGSLAAAVTAGQQVASYEQNITCNQIGFTVLEVEPLVLGAGGGTVASIGYNGEGDFDIDAALLDVCVRCVFRPSAGKPSQKWLRGVLSRANYNPDTGALTQGLRDFITSSYVTPLSGLAAFVDVDGQTFVGASVFPTISKRQLKRRRRARPGFKRGWVTA